MFNTKFSKTIVILVAMLMLATLVLTACNPVEPFTPVEMPEAGQVTGNGGIAVGYGDWIYYVNGYQSSYTADNTHNGVVRTGSIVRIKKADIAPIIALNDEDMSSKDLAEAIQNEVRAKVELVVPHFVYSSNTTEHSYNGLFIFGDRIYFTTANDAVDANGDLLTNQLALCSAKLDGSDVQKHYVFPSTATMYKLAEQEDGSLVGWYVADNTLSSLNVSEGTSKVLAEEISSVKLDGENVFFMDEEKAIWKYILGESDANCIVEATDDQAPVTLLAASNGYAYYTIGYENTPEHDEIKVFYANSEVDGQLVLNTSMSSYFGYNGKLLYTRSVSGEVTTYGVWIAHSQGSQTIIEEILSPNNYDTAITLNKLEGRTLYFTVANVYYSMDIETKSEPVALGYNVPTSATGWAKFDIEGEFLFTFNSTGTVSIAQFNAETKKNSDTTNFTLTVEVEETEEDAQ